MKRDCADGRDGVGPDEQRRAMAARTVLEFDDVFVAQRNGFGTADRYYAINSARQFLPKISVPTLVVHARDDPWIPVDAYLRHDWSLTPLLTPLLPDAGLYPASTDIMAASIPLTVPMMSISKLSCIQYSMPLP